jgi:hypothetical protein
MTGLDIYKTKDKFVVARLHYTADPQKRTPEAISRLLEGYVGGRAGSAWRKEMEIDFTAYAGQLLCYHLIQNYRSKIIIDKQVSPQDFKYGSVDWGRSNPASFHTYAIGLKGSIHSANEIYQNDMSIPTFCSLIKQSEYYKELKWISADPSLWNKNQETKEGLRSLENMFKDEGIHLRKGKSKDDQLAINELLDRWDKLEEKEPQFTISPKCSKQIWEFERLRYKELTTAMFDQKNYHETLVDKDNHSWDDFKYFISTWLTKPTEEHITHVPRHSPEWFMREDDREAKNWRKNY